MIHGRKRIFKNSYSSISRDDCGAASTADLSVAPTIESSEHSSEARVREFFNERRRSGDGLSR
jgi:hypothetical protein